MFQASKPFESQITQRRITLKHHPGHKLSSINLTHTALMALMARITIALPLYRDDGQSRMSIASALAQNEKKCKVLIVDNNPNVDRWYIPLDHPGITYIRNEANIGGKNFAKCWELADTDYIHFLGDDDFMLPGYVDILDSAITAHEGEFVALASLPCDRRSSNFKLYSSCLDNPPNASTALDRTKQVVDQVAYNFWWYSLIDRRKVSYNQVFDKFLDSWPLSAVSSDWLFTYWLATQGKMLFSNQLGFIYNYQNWSGNWHQDQLVQFGDSDLKCRTSLDIAEIHQLYLCQQILMIFTYYVHAWHVSSCMNELNPAELISIVTYLCFVKISREIPMGLPTNSPLVQLANVLRSDGYGIDQLMKMSTQLLLEHTSKATELTRFIQELDRLDTQFKLASFI